LEGGLKSAKKWFFRILRFSLPFVGPNKSAMVSKDAEKNSLQNDIC
jgi:hypothetical protein